MLDTNVLISAFVFKSDTIDRVVRDVATRQELVLCTFVNLNLIQPGAQGRVDGRPVAARS